MYLTLVEVPFRDTLRFRLRIPSSLEKFSGVLITVTDPDASSKKSYIKTNSKVSRSNGKARAILLQNHLPFEENSLRGAAVDLFGLTDHHGVVLEVVEDDYLSDSEVFESALHDAFFEVSIKA